MIPLRLSRAEAIAIIQVYAASVDPKHPDHGYVQAVAYWTFAVEQSLIDLQRRLAALEEGMRGKA